jgi:anti-anti-sigma factor
MRAMSGTQLPAARGEPVTITLPAEIDVSNVTAAGLDLVSPLWAGATVVIADLTGTRFCDARGAAMLARAHREAVTAGAELRIATSAHVRRVLALTRLDRELAIYPTLPAAQAGLPGQRPPGRSRN